MKHYSGLPRLTLALTWVISFTLPLVAQEYSALLSDDKSWDVYQWEGGSITPYVAGQRQFVAGDTVFGGQSYQIIRAFDMVSDQPVFANPFTLEENSSIVGFMREDEVNQKVYTWNSDDNQEVLTYDFSLEAGDSLLVPYLDDHFIHLDSISTIILTTGEERRKFHFSNLPIADDDDFYLEGIGGHSGLLFPFDFNFERGTDLGCVKADAQIIFGAASCELISSSRELQVQNAAVIYPNPASGTLYFSASRERIHTLELFNIQGIRILRQAIEQQTGQLDLRGLPSGTYLARIWFEGNRFQVQRVVKL